MKLILTILFLSLCLATFGQDTTATTSVDTNFYVNKTVKHKKEKSKYNKVAQKDDGYKVVVPTQSEYKLTVPKRVVTRQTDLIMYNTPEQEVWVDNSDNAFTHEINVAKRALETQNLTYYQLQHLLNLPYIR